MCSAGIAPCRLVTKRSEVQVLIWQVVCKCEKVTEAEVVEACRRSLPVDSTQTMRKRNRAGMGGCQGKPWCAALACLLTDK